MIIQCTNCSKKFIVKDKDIPAAGRVVQCGYCSVTWHQLPVSVSGNNVKKPKVIKPAVKTDEKSSANGIKASDGKTYKFLGSQWAILLPSGKTGIFAKKAISRELNKIVGRKEKTIIKEDYNELRNFDPSSYQLPDTYKPKKSLGFLGYIFIITILVFSFVVVMKMIEDNWLNYYPQHQYIFDLLDEQLKYIIETTRNIIIIVEDFIKSY